MALTIKHLNADASFLLSFEPVVSSSCSLTSPPPPFTILLDPWITGPSKIFHSKISMTTHKQPACISSLAELPEPDIVIISQHKSDHCNEATLRQLPARGTKTKILAETASAKLIRSWKYFEPEKIVPIERWEDPRDSGRETVIRMAVPPLVSGWEAGEVTVAFIPQRRDISGLHSAVAITYKAPSTGPSSVVLNLGQAAKRGIFPRGLATAHQGLLTPPATPKSQVDGPASSLNTLISPPSSYRCYCNAHATTDALLFPPSSPTPTSPGLSSLRTIQSCTSLPLTPMTTSTTAPSLPTTTTAAASSYSYSPVLPATAAGAARPLSVLFSPHGVAYASLAPFASSHLVREAALPLTALLHCLDAVSNPWWLGGRITLGAAAGAETAAALAARAWVGAHDGDKDVRGLATAWLRTRRWARDEVESALAEGRERKKGKGKGKGATTKEKKGARARGHGNSATATATGARAEAGELVAPSLLGSRATGMSAGGGGRNGTEIIALDVGGEVVLTGDGLWSGAECDEKWQPAIPPKSIARSIRSRAQSAAEGQAEYRLDVAPRLPEIVIQS